jgi:hypothetical protein
MSETEATIAAPRGFWEKLIDSLRGRRRTGEEELPEDSLFAMALPGVVSVADVPENVKAQIRDAAVLDMFNQLESSLRLLLYATAPGKEPPTAERCQQILSVWRFELEERVNLLPDTYCGAVQPYEPVMDSAYTIYGRVNAGDLLRIRVPCWRMQAQVVVRGEAEVVAPGTMGATPEAATAQAAAPVS